MSDQQRKLRIAELKRAEVAFRARLEVLSHPDDPMPWLEAVMAIGGVALAGATFGVSLAVGVFGFAWWAQGAIEQKAAAAEMRYLREELARVVAERRRQESE